MISSEQRRSLDESIRSGLLAFAAKQPQTCSDWANENFYLSPESSNSEGRWESLPFQVAILNMMGNDEIRTLDVLKSARIGYTKMVAAGIGYHAEHKKRNQIIYQPVDGDAVDFMKDTVETMVRDCPIVRSIAPWHGKKHRQSTIEQKTWSNGRKLYVRGGKAARNYRRISVDSVWYDELSSFEADIEGEGSPTWLGDKRAANSSFPKSVRGSSPKERGTCQIEMAADEADEFFRRYVPCPHCGEKQVLHWGEDNADFGFKWEEEDGKATRVWYQCEHCDAEIDHASIYEMDEAGEWRSESGMVTVDGILFYRDGVPVETPRHVAVHIWAAYNPFTTWSVIVGDFLKARNDPSKLKTFTNTTLGETSEDAVGEKLEWETLYARREHYATPKEIVYVTAGADIQDDRIEWEVVGWGADEQSWSMDYRILMGNTGEDLVWTLLAEELRKTYTRDDGGVLRIGTTCIDSGHKTDNVYAFSRAFGTLDALPVKGANSPNEPVATFPVKMNRKGVYLVTVGTQNAKDLIASHLRINPQDDGNFPAFYCHYPVRESHGPTYFKQLLAERKVRRVLQGRQVYRWECPEGHRNEPWDCRVYATAALRVAQQRKGINLKTITPNAPAAQPRRRRVLSRGVR